MATDATSGIYMIRRVGSVECYVGQSMNIEKRFREHKSKLRCGHHPGRHLQSVFDKHGPDALEFIILETGFGPDERMDMTLAEQGWMDRVRPAYNVLAAAGRVGAWHSAETGEKISHGRRGIKASAETRARMSAARIGNKNRVGHTPWMKGRAHTEEAKRRVSEANKGRPSPAKGVAATSEFRQKVSAACRAAHERARLAKAGAPENE